MRVRVFWKNHLDWPDQQLGHQSFWEGTSLEDALGQCFHEVLLDIAAGFHLEKAIPLQCKLEFGFEVFDAQGDPIKCTSPAMLYESLISGSSFLLAPRGRKGNYNGNAKHL